MCSIASRLRRSMDSAMASSSAFITSMLASDARLCSRRRPMANVSKHARASFPACSPTPASTKRHVSRHVRRHTMPDAMLQRGML